MMMSFRARRSLSRSISSSVVAAATAAHNTGASTASVRAFICMRVDGASERKGEQPRSHTAAAAAPQQCQHYQSLLSGSVCTRSCCPLASEISPNSPLTTVIMAWILILFVSSSSPSHFTQTSFFSSSA